MDTGTGSEWPDIEPPVETEPNFELPDSEEPPSGDDTPWEELQALEISQGPIMAENARRVYFGALYEQLQNSEIDWSLEGNACRVVGCPWYGEVWENRSGLKKHLETTAHLDLDASFAPIDEVTAPVGSSDNTEELPSLVATEASPQARTRALYERASFQRNSKPQAPLMAQWSSSKIKGKVIAVTGAASGIGFAVAKLLASRRAQLSLADMDKAGLEAALESLPGDGHIITQVDSGGSIADIDPRLLWKLEASASVGIGS
ncbi:Levodione reductase [Fusarium subglutinans]|uniref:Levodione reductase n=1 Tax=Gibberella subglutinans TaxID=42677 RepID=A0A8H5Q6J9_GIBSU|nr:Levodione reductase [Fusarium subglutinans]KAF5608962.1 Levodione reductase [Fusarium subglutinans]